MEIRINGHIFKEYNHASVTLKYDSVCSHFAFKLYFDPNNPVHKATFKPFTYPACTIHHNGVLLLTGIVENFVFSTAGNPPKQLVVVTGYSKTGVLQKCPIMARPLQNNGLSFIALIDKLTKYYQEKWNFKLMVDPEVADIVQTVIPTSNFEINDRVIEYIDKTCSHLQLVLSHTREGNLYITKVKNDKVLTNSSTFVSVSPTPLSSEIEGAPSFDTVRNEQQQNDRAILYDFTHPGQWTGVEGKYDGGRMHSDIEVVAQDNPAATNAVESDVIKNPIVQIGNRNNDVFDQETGTGTAHGYLPDVVVQTRRVEDFDNKAPLTARQLVNDELKGINVVIKVSSWVLNNHMITPNQMVTVTAPDIYLYHKTTLFIQEVHLSGNEIEETATLVCVPPFAFGDEEIKNIF